MVGRRDARRRERTNGSAGGEVNIPLDLQFEQNLTLGAEWNREQLNDPNSMLMTDASGAAIDDSSGDLSSRSP